MSYGSVTLSSLHLWTCRLPCIALLLLILSNDVEQNPGPKTPKYPCGICSKAVKWSDKGVACDSCSTWFHTQCMGMCDEIYNSLAPNISWTCFQCGLPNFSTQLFMSTQADGKDIPPSLAEITHATTISDHSATNTSDKGCAIGHPLCTSSPKDKPKVDYSNTTSSISSISAASDPLLRRPQAVKSNQSVRVLVINFQSLRPKKHEFWNLLEATDPDIIMGTETWLRPYITNCEVLPTTYDVYRRDRADGRGGVMVATKKTLITHQVPADPNAEAVLVSIQTHNRASNLIVGALYRPPSAVSHDHITSMTRVMEQACQSQNDVVWLGGDLNLPDINWKTSSVEGSQYPKSMNQKYLDAIQNLGLLQTNHTPTRGEAVLDYFLTNRPNLQTRICTLPALSDHDIVMSDSVIQAPRIKPVPRVIFSWSKANVAELKKDLASFTDDLLNTTKESTPVQEIWTRIHSALSKALYDHVPSKTGSIKQHQPWINNTIKRLSRRKNRAWKKAKASGKNQDWQRFKHLQKNTRRACRAAHANYVAELITEDGDSRRMWQFIKNKRCDATGVAPLRKEGLTYSDAAAKANILNEQFCSVFTTEDMQNLPDLGESPYPDMPNIEVTVQGVHKLLRNLNPRKACGPDNIPCRLLVLAAQEIAPALTLLFSSSLQTGEIPDAWRHALIQPAFKKGDRSSAANYRPISLTSVCCKLLEHIVRSAITSHLDQHNILVDSQHGFRKGRSCETQLILTVDDLAAVLEESGQTDTILLDFSKAFDKVPHRRLLLKLHHTGIRGRTLKWMDSFLSDRTQQVLVEGQRSQIGKVTSGVPQGSVLGPTLFLVYINDLVTNVQSTVRLFADDTMLYRAIRTQADTSILQEDLNQLEAWESEWQMSFNASKCHVLTITKKRKPLTATYTLHGEDLSAVDSAKYLGVELSKDLHWGKHIHSVTAKANTTSAFIYRNLRGCPHKIQSTCYKGLVRPLLEYAAPIWDPHQQFLCNEIEMVQRRSARRICRDFRPTTSATELVSKLQLEPLQLRRTTAKATMMYKIMNGLVDMKPRSGTIVPATRSTRGQSHKLQVPCSRTEVHKNSFFPSAIRLWNRVPTEATATSSPQAFRSIVEAWLRRE